MSIEDEAAIQHLVVGVSHEIDHRRWPELRALFAETVRVDYTSLFGGEAQALRADDLVATWKTRLATIEATQHLLGPIAVTVQGARAIASCHVRAYHRLARAPGGPEWMVAGHYAFELTRNAGWKIDRMTLETFYQTGNTRLLDEAVPLAQ
jgi:hypothetical protein